MPTGGDDMSDIRPEIAEKIQDSIDFLEENLEEDIRLEDLARVACFSIFHYHRLFKEVVGQPAIDYLRKRRLAKAADELIETDEKIASIALRYQFCSQESFTRAFSRQFGLPPGRYRKGGARMFVSPLAGSSSGRFHAQCMLRAA